MSAQFAPPGSQRRHWYAYEIGSVPVHVPRVAVSVSPSRAVPEICGAVALTGGAAATVAVGVVAAVVEPAPFVAVTTARRVVPASAAVSVYDARVAPPRSVQLAPFVSQRRHWYAYAIAGVPVQVPRSTVRISPSRVVPEIDGAVVLTAATGATVALCPVVTGVEPAALLAVTTRRIVAPTSAGVSA